MTDDADATISPSDRRLLAILLGAFAVPFMAASFAWGRLPATVLTLAVFLAALAVWVYLLADRVRD